MTDSIQASAISTHGFLVGFVTAAEGICAARDELCALDAIAGDGDLGATLATGFSAVINRLNEATYDDVSQIFTAAGSEIARKAPSTSGALLATAFLTAARVSPAGPTITGGDLAEMLLQGAIAVSERGGAQAGQRTMLDAMFPAASAAQVGAARGDSALAVLEIAAAAAASGAAATAEMEPQHGRAGWVRERARGEADAGAVAWALFLRGLSHGCGGA